MENKLSDYIHYYIGCYGVLNSRDTQLIGVTIGSYQFIDVDTNQYGDGDLGDFKPILRRLEDISDEEKTELGKRFGWYEGKQIFNDHHLEIAHETTKEMAYDAVVTADESDADRLGPTAYFAIMPYLTKQSFDLFGLIDEIGRA